MKNLENICRVCLNRGSRNIFENSSSAENQFTIPPISDNVSSLDRLPEKLRYVTMLKIEECENLPKSMCDSCIIQLNVAYNLKKNAIQSDMKIRQYMIEYGVGVTSYTTCSINTVSVIHPTPMIMSAPNDPNNGSSSTVPKSTSIAVTEQQPFPVRPFIIKEEPIDYEIMSDITVGTDTFDDHLQYNRNVRTSMNPSRNDINQQQQSLKPLPSNTMVAVNTKSLLLSTREASDNEYLRAYMPTSLSNLSESTPTTSSTKLPTDQRNKTVSKTIEQSPMATEQSNDATKLTKKDTTKEIKKKPANKGTQKRTISQRVTRQDGERLLETRTRGGSFAKKDYTSFYMIRSNTPTDLAKRIKIKDNKRGRLSIGTSSAKVSSTKKQRTFSPNTAATKKRKLDLRKRSTL